MITAVDTNVLLDVFDDDPKFVRRSLATLRACEAEGRLIACGVVWAEVASRFPSADAARATMSRVGIQFSSIEAEAAVTAGAAWSDYRRRGGPRTRIASDFLIGAHALTQADRLLTRDRGFYRSYFHDLTVLDPSVE